MRRYPGRLEATHATVEENGKSVAVLLVRRFIVDVARVGVVSLKCG